MSKESFYRNLFLAIVIFLLFLAYTAWQEFRGTAIIST